jgi:RNA polymerase sigma-70 factor (ECF subfamily)
LFFYFLVFTRPVSLSASPSTVQHPASGEPSPSQHVLRWEQEVLVAAALEQLPDDHRDVLLLRNLERLPFEEVAKRMGRSAGACRMLWMRAIAGLKEQLGGTSIDP